MCVLFILTTKKFDGVFSRLWRAGARTKQIPFRIIDYTTNPAPCRYIPVLCGIQRKKEPAENVGGLSLGGRGLKRRQSKVANAKYDSAVPAAVKHA